MKKVVETTKEKWLIGSLTGAVVFNKVAKYIQIYLKFSRGLFINLLNTHRKKILIFNF